MTMAAVVRDLHKSYGSQQVLSGANLEIPAGSVTALLGPSGCGKTTLLRLLAGFDRPDSGDITLGGIVVDGPQAFVPARRRRVGYVPQEGALFTHLSVAANIGFGVPRAQRRDRTAQLLDLIGLAALADRRPDELSGGQQQRVALARALAVKPHLVLLDEPFSALDPGLRNQVRADVLALLRSTGTTTLLVTHDQEEALSVADQIAVLDQGQVVQAATPEQLYASPASANVARFVGAGTLLPATRVNELEIHCALGLLPSLFGSLQPGASSGTVLVRSEQLRLESDVPTEPRAAHPHAVHGRVTDRAFYGHDTVVTVLLEQEESHSTDTYVTARTPGTTEFTIGSGVRLAVLGPVVFYADSGGQQS